MTLTNNQKYEGYTTVNADGKRIIDLNLGGKSSLDLAVTMKARIKRFWPL